MTLSLIQKTKSELHCFISAFEPLSIIHNLALCLKLVSVYKLNFKTQVLCCPSHIPSVQEPQETSGAHIGQNIKYTSIMTEVLLNRATRAH